MNIDHTFDFQSIDLQVYVLPQNILVKLVSSVRNLIPWHGSLIMLYQGPLLLTWFNFNPSMDK